MGYLDQTFFASHESRAQCIDNVKATVLHHVAPAAKQLQAPVRSLVLKISAIILRHGRHLRVKTTLVVEHETVVIKCSADLQETIL